MSNNELERPLFVVDKTGLVIGSITFGPTFSYGPDPNFNYTKNHEFEGGGSYIAIKGPSALLQSQQQDRELIRELVEAIKEAFQWIDNCGDMAGNQAICDNIEKAIQKANQRLGEQI